MSINNRIIECISNISGIDVALQRIRPHWVKENDSNPLRREATESIYLKLGIVNRELVELRRIAKMDGRLNKILLTLEPFTRELDYYQDGIKTYRDQYIAHYNRGNNYKFQSVGDMLRPDLVLPRANGEIELLIKVTHFFSDMLIHFYEASWAIFQKDMLDKLEVSLTEFGKNFIPRTPVNLENNIAEVNRLAVHYHLIPLGSDLIVIAKQE